MDDLPDTTSKDVMESKNLSKPDVLSEEDFIKRSTPPPKTGPLPLWLWLALLTLGIALVWGSLGSFKDLTKKEIQSRPFLEVTNRQFSLFLWQFPVFMRTHASQKSGYLPGFQYGETFTLDLASAEEYVTAPPEILFIYHTWNRLLAPDFIESPIPLKEFIEFLGKVPEWQPRYWKGAPQGYIDLIDSGKYTETEDLRTLAESDLPRIVRQAFQGWKNYFKDGNAVNLLTPTFKTVTRFLTNHPNYARNYWRNIRYIDNKEVAGSAYLQSFLQKNDDAEALVPSDQIAPFLKVALFNAEQAESSR